ncbi:lipopolysaccharide biosynthesis protein [Rhizobium phaseoli]|uniref:lipopolysaccharide biosynthesis protein n=1 Tax=Rhizobium phaseoli TaxID=396 RepID=UPI001FCDA68D|nr:lipopolysaccharide biosynthesis protein [Rhizobium phaseoli]
MFVNVKKKAVEATLWSVVRIGVDQVFSFIVFVVIARILGPVEVGLFAIGMIVAEIGRIFATSGFSDAVTKAGADDEEIVSRVAFWGNVGMAVVCAALITVLARPISWLMATDRLEGVLTALAWTLPISAGGAIHMARQLRRFGHKTLAIRSIVAGLIGSVVAVWAAYHNFGVYALVIQRFITELVTTLTAWLAFRWWPSVKFTRAQLIEVLPFSASMSASKLIGVINSRVQDMIIGIFVGAASVGFYRVARRTIDMLSIGTLTPISTVSVNLFVAIREDQAKVKQTFTRLLSVSGALSFPAFFGLAAIAKDLVTILYGERWLDVVPLMQALSLFCIPSLISLLFLPVLTSFGQSKKALRFTTIQFIVTVILALVAAPFGLWPIILSLLARGYVMIPYQIRLIEPHTKCSLAEVGLAILRPLAAASAMGLACYFLVEYGLAPIQNVIWRLIAAVSAGIIIYTTVLSLIDRQSIVWLIQLARSRAEKRS